MSWFPIHLAFYQNGKIVTRDDDDSWQNTWCYWFDRFGNREMAYMKVDAKDHFEPQTKIIHEYNIIGWSERGFQEPGGWISTKNGETVICSNCEFEFEYESDFCPCCGADMRGDGE